MALVVLDYELSCRCHHQASVFFTSCMCHKQDVFKHFAGVYLDLGFQDDKSPFLWTATWGLFYDSRPGCKQTGALPAKPSPLPKWSSHFQGEWPHGIMHFVLGMTFSLPVWLSSGHDWLALGGERWRPPVSLTRVERVWWFPDKRQAGQRGTALCLRDVLMRSGEIRGLRPYSAWNLMYQDATVEAADLVWFGLNSELGCPVFLFIANTKSNIFIYHLCFNIHMLAEAFVRRPRSLFSLCVQVWMVCDELAARPGCIPTLYRGS